GNPTSVAGDLVLQAVAGGDGGRAKPPEGFRGAGVGAVTDNLFTDLPAHLPDELFTTLLDAAGVRIERIVSHGHASPEGFWYDKDRPEWVVVLKGAARLRFEDGTVEMVPGDFVDIPAHKRHRVEWTT